MKKLILGLALVIALAGCSSNSYKVSGKLDDATIGTVYLKKIMAQGLEDVDSTEMVDGAFTFEGEIEYPELYLVYYEDNQTPIALFIENTNITITGSTDAMNDAIIKGSKLNNLFKSFNDDIPHQEKVEQMREEFFSAQRTGDEATMESIMADMQVIIEEQQNYYRNFVKNNSDNALGAFLALNMAQALSPEELEEIYDNLQRNLPGHPYVENLEEIMLPMRSQKEAEEAQQQAELALAVGHEAPVFSLNDLNGNEISLDNFRGKYVFLDFWAAWCRPCRQQKPILKEVYNRFGGENFEIVSVSLDQTEEAWKQAVEEDGLNWTLLHDPIHNVAQTYAVQSIPNTWLLDKEGNILEKQLGGDELMAILETLLEN